MRIPARMSRCERAGERQASAAATRSITPLQSPSFSCRNRRALGYHGLSSRPSIHRQSGAAATRIHTGTPSAPATCATAVSTVITRSRWRIAAAVSPKSVSREPSEMTGLSAASAALSPTCRLAHAMSGRAKSGASAANDSERSRSC